MEEKIIKEIDKARKTIKDNECIMVDETVILLRKCTSIWNLINDSYMLGYIRGLEKAKKMV